MDQDYSQFLISTMVKPFGTKTSYFSTCCRWTITKYKNGGPVAMLDLGVGFNKNEPYIFVTTGVHLTKQYSLFAEVSKNTFNIRWFSKICKGLTVGVEYCNFDTIRPVATYNFVPWDLICSGQKPSDNCNDLITSLLCSNMFITIAWESIFSKTPYIGFGIHI